jgi:CHRD domain-containing protein
MTMKRSGLLILALCAVAVACGDDDAPTTPTNQPIVFGAAMSAGQEVPPISNAEQAATGAATVTFNVTRDASNRIQSGTVDMEFTLTGFPAGSTAILAHIHTGAAGVPGGVLIGSGLSAASPVAMPSGSGTFSARNITADAATLQSIVDNPSGFYYNVHTTVNPGGAVRGQLVRR